MENRKKKTKKYILLFLAAALLLIIYKLADRYLIEHAESTVPDIEKGNASVTETPGNIYYDDWNYTSNTIKINIQKIESGSGKDMLTYFVADVTLKDSGNLLSAFAKDTYGRNIVETTSKIASDNQAIFAVNGDYYGFRSDGILIRNGTLYRDVPTRTAAALLKNGTMKIFDETKTASSSLLAEGVMNTLSFGPVLVSGGKAVEDFGKVAVDTNFGNRSIQGQNPRTGIGIISANHYVFIVVDGRKEGYSRGMELSEFARLFADLDCTEAYNLDGGGSSTMYFMGRVVNNPLGKQKERSISDILYIRE